MAHLEVPSTVGPTFALFALASLLLSVIPGPAVVYLVTRTLAQGRGAGLASIGGVAHTRHFRRFQRLTTMRQVA
jgi:hypothetical protein